MTTPKPDLKFPTKEMIEQSKKTMALIRKYRPSKPKDLEDLKWALAEARKRDAKK